MQSPPLQYSQVNSYSANSTLSCFPSSTSMNNKIINSSSRGYSFIKPAGRSNQAHVIYNGYALPGVYKSNYPIPSNTMSGMYQNTSHGVIYTNPYNNTSQYPQGAVVVGVPTSQMYSSAPVVFVEPNRHQQPCLNYSAIIMENNNIMTLDQLFQLFTQMLAFTYLQRREEIPCSVKIALRFHDYKRMAPSETRTYSRSVGGWGVHSNNRHRMPTFQNPPSRIPPTEHYHENRSSRSYGNSTDASSYVSNHKSKNDVVDLESDEDKQNSKSTKQQEGNKQPTNSDDGSKSVDEKTPPLSEELAVQQPPDSPPPEFDEVPNIVIKNEKGDEKPVTEEKNESDTLTKEIIASETLQKLASEKVKQPENPHPQKEKRKRGRPRKEKPKNINVDDTPLDNNPKKRNAESADISNENCQIENDRKENPRKKLRYSHENESDEESDTKKTNDEIKEKKIHESKDKPNRKKSGKNHGDDIFQVEKILKKRTQKGVTQYYVKWLGYSKKENTWVNEKDIFDKSLIKKFHEQRRKVK